VPRGEFDQLLLRRAAELGATVREGVEVTDLLLDGSRVVGVRARSEGGEHEELRAPVVVDATGRDTAFATRMRSKSALPGLDKTAFFAHFRGAERLAPPNEGDLRIVLFEHGWMWLIPLRGELTSVGVVVSSEWVKARARDESVDEYFHRTLALSSWTRAILANAERVAPVRTAADFSYRTRDLAGDGWLAVGDAGGFLDPIFSTGAHLAIKGADLAAAAIDAALARGDTSRAAFAEYERSQREATDLFFGLVRDFYAGDLAETLFAPAQRPTMRRLITTLLAGDVFHPETKPPWVAWVRARYPATVLGA
jgi:flavin-dependent dehydrogenase